ncbi:MAG: ABC transporter permease subunit [Alphaproteobacteria bacterium]
MINISRKHHFSKEYQRWATVIAAGLALLLFFIFLGIWQISFGDVAEALVMVVVDGDNFRHFLALATALILLGLVSAMAFRGGIFYLSVEGQFLAGMMLSAWLIDNFYITLGAWLLPVVIVAASMLGLLLGLLVGALRHYMRLHEILGSMFLVYGVHYFFNDVKTTIVWAETYRLLADALPELSFPIFGSGIFYAFLITTLFALLYQYHIVTFVIKLMGYGRKAIAEIGKKEDSVYWMIMMVGGALAGSAGFLAVLDNWVVTDNNDAISVVPLWSLTIAVIVVIFFGRMTPIAIGIAGLFFALVASVIENLDLALAVADGLFQVFCAMSLLLLLLVDFLNKYQIEMGHFLRRSLMMVDNKNATGKHRNVRNGDVEILYKKGQIKKDDR